MQSDQPNIDLLDTHSPLNQAVQFLTSAEATPPPSDKVVEALLLAEKKARQTNVAHAYSQLQGTWRLGFITGTKRSREKAGVILGSGRFLPAWVNISLSYAVSESHSNQGTVQNSVKLGPLQLILTGPTQWQSKMNRLIFDFTQMRVLLFGVRLYSGYIRGGQEKEVQFYETAIKHQAFFTYFLVDHRSIAARGRGGGLALWTRAAET